MTLRALWTWLRSDGPQYVSHWTPERARRAERDTLRQLGRGETAYLWSRKIKRGKGDKVMSFDRKQRSA